MSRSLHRSTLAITAFAMSLSLGVAACGGEEEKKGGGGGGQADIKNEIKKIPGAEKTKLTIGSKDFPEQFILGEIYAQALEAAGFKVKKDLSLGAEQIAHKALKAGAVDAYPEYTGTALTSFFDVKIKDAPKDPKAAYEQAKAEYAKEGIIAFPQGPFDNTYIIASNQETNKKLKGIKKISELKEPSKDLKLAGNPECRQRSDCLLGLQETYGLDPEFVANKSGDNYTPIDSGQADIGMVFSTDGALSTGKYALYEDDKNLFPVYNITLTMREEVAKKIGPEGQRVIEMVQRPLTDEVMRELNSRVTLDKQEPEEVAREYLREAGFIG